MALALAAVGGFHHIAGRGRLSLVRARATGANALVQRIFDLSSAGDLAWTYMPCEWLDKTF